MVTESRFNYNYRWIVCVDGSNLLGQHGQHCVCAGPGLFGPNARIAITGVHSRCQLFSVKNQLLTNFGARSARSRLLQVVLRAEPRCRRMPTCQTRILSLLPTWNSTRTCRCRRPMTLLLLSRDGSRILKHRSQLLRSDAFALVSRHSPWNNLRSRADIES